MCGGLLRVVARVVGLAVQCAWHRCVVCSALSSLSFFLGTWFVLGVIHVGTLMYLTQGLQSRGRLVQHAALGVALACCWVWVSVAAVLAAW